MKCLLIGGLGFIGRNLITHLLNKNIKVRCLDRQRMIWLPEEVDFIEGDFTAPHLLDSIFRGCDVVIHLASTVIPETSNKDPEFDVSSNLVGAIRLMEIAVHYKIKKFLFLSSGGTVYGVPQELPITETHPTNPTCSYGIVKLAIEKYLDLFYKQHGLPTCSIRLANPYGQYQRGDTKQGVIGVFCYRVLSSLPIEIWGNGRVERDFIHIDDVCTAIISLLNTECRGEIFNVGSGESISLNHILSQIENQVGRKIEVVYRSERGFDVPKNCLSIDRITERCGWKPVISLSEGLRRTIEWQRKEFFSAGALGRTIPERALPRTLESGEFALKQK